MSTRPKTREQWYTKYYRDGFKRRSRCTKHFGYDIFHDPSEFRNNSKTVDGLQCYCETSRKGRYGAIKEEEKLRVAMLATTLSLSRAIGSELQRFGWR